MSFTHSVIFGLSIVFAAVIGMIRFYKIDTAFHPFIILCWFALFAELVNINTASKGGSTALSFNLYSFAEAILLLWQFRRWGLFTKRVISYGLQVVVIVVWVVEMYHNDPGIHYYSYHTILYSFLMIVLCIPTMVHILFFENKLVLYNSKFIICLGLLIYFTYGLFAEVTWVMGLKFTSEFRKNAHDIISYINLFTNVMFAFAVLWIPMRLRYIMQ